jgi:hypothetical protein
MNERALETTSCSFVIIGRYVHETSGTPVSHPRMNMMLTSIQTVTRKGARCATAAALTVCALLSACASGVTNTTSYVPATQVRPGTIYVSAFDASADQVKLDNSGVIQKIKSQFDSATPEQKQAEQAAQVREQLANEIVQQLQSEGLHAVRLDTPAPADQNALIIQGKFETIDAGNRRRRILIGLGAGKSELSTSVLLLYKPIGGVPVVVHSFTASADSGHMPGMAETAGVGAAAGQIATSAAVGAGLHGVSEKKQNGASGETKKLAESIAKQVQQIGKQQGWIPAESTKS